jgi:two-component system, chemotaxis family, response regulator Rcp1
LIAAAKTEVTEVLLVEDNPGDTRLTLEAIRECDLPLNLNVVRNGFEAMAFLRREGRYSTVERPALILLDLNLPGKGGREVLAEIKGDPELRRIPVVVLTTSQSEDDIAAAYRLHANCYIRKPADTNQLSGIVKGIEDFWLTKVRLPC